MHWDFPNWKREKSRGLRITEFVWILCGAGYHFCAGLNYYYDTSLGGWQGLARVETLMEECIILTTFCLMQISHEKFSRKDHLEAMS